MPNQQESPNAGKLEFPVISQGFSIALWAKIEPACGIERRYKSQNGADLATRLFAQQIGFAQGMERSMGWLDFNTFKFTGTKAAGISLKVDANSLLPPPGTRCGKWLCIPAISSSSKKSPGRTNYITGSSRRLNHERF